MILNSAGIWGKEGAGAQEGGPIASNWCGNPPGKFMKQNLTGSGGSRPASLATTVPGVPMG